MLILDLWGISFHAVIVFGLGKNVLFKSVLGHCVWVSMLVRNVSKLNITLSKNDKQKCHFDSH